MTPFQHAHLIITLTALGQFPDAFDNLDVTQLEALIVLLEEARKTAEARRAALVGDKETR